MSDIDGAESESDSSSDSSSSDSNMSKTSDDELEASRQQMLGELKQIEKESKKKHHLQQ